MKLLQKLFKKSPVERNFIQSEIESMAGLQFGTKGSVMVDNKPFLFHDAGCFYNTYQEIIKDNIYHFKTSSKKPYIIDCGANMGLSIYYFAKEYPNAEIVAFEPEEEIYSVLEKNIATFQLANVKLYKKAVWNTETTLEFYSDKGMGGSVENKYNNQKPTYIETLRLANFLNKKVDMLKLDIEGAEYTVLKDCKQLLKNVENIFVEYHSFINKEQHLDDVLLILKQEGFRYHLRESFFRKMPFIDKNLACDNMDMAINIFAYRD